MKNFKETLIKWGIVPTYTEASLFLMGVTFILLFLTNSELREDMFIQAFNDLVIYWVFILGGIVFSTYHVFSGRKKTKLEKYFMLISALLVNLFVSFAAGAEIIVSDAYYGNNGNYLFIFPLWNMISAELLLFLFLKGFVDTDLISEKQTKIRETIIGSVGVVVVFFVSQYIFNNFWAITFSICVAYATSLNEIVNRLFFKL